MRVIFLSEKSGALFVNGAYFGTVDGFERSASLDPADGLFCECRPAGYAPLCFRFDEAFLFSPPQGVKLFFSGGDVAVYLCDFARADPSLSVVWQERIGGSLLTLCMQGRLQLNLENETGFHLIPLPERMERCRPSACGEQYLLETDDEFMLLARDGSVLVEARGGVTARDGTLEAEVRFPDSMGHTALCSWREGKLVSSVLRATREPTDATFALALFESVRIGADCTPFLSDALKPKAKLLGDFLGKFEACVMKDDARLVGLVYARKERVYDVRCFRVDVEDGKIVNLAEA